MKKQFSFVLVAALVASASYTIADDKVIIIPLGKTTSVEASINWRGEWATGKSYQNGDGVQWEGSSYLCVGDSDCILTPPYGSWDLMAAKGASGVQGPAGPIGDTGATGAQGPAGPIGDTGATGAQGPAGPIGDTGATGAQGPVGPIGDTGATGAQGPVGATGDKGDTGSSGTSSWTDGTGIVSTSSNVGIGTTSPTEELDVNGILIVDDDNPGVDINGYIDVKRNSVVKAARIAQQGTGNILELGTTTDGTDVTFQEKMIVSKSGYVGIGTTNPLSKLAVNGLPTSPPDSTGNAGVVCVTNSGNFWLDNDGTNDCL